MLIAIDEEESEVAGELPPAPEIQSPPLPRLVQSRLHNFSFPTWGAQKLLRCSNYDPRREMKGGKEANDQEPSSSARPWNLRKRRSAGDPIALQAEEKREPARKVTVALSRKEIEHDFLLVKGTKPPRRRTKRPRALQKQLDEISPGLRLSQITIDRYKTED